MSERYTDGFEDVGTNVKRPRRILIDDELDLKQDTVSGVSDTELSYVNGVTSAIQTQLNNKQAVVSGVDDTEIGYLNGVTSAIQTQINTKAPTLVTSNIGVAGTGTTAVEYGDGYQHTTVLTVDSVLPAITGGVDQATGKLLYTLPAGACIINNAYMSMAITQSESHINADTPDIGLGTTIGSGANATLDAVGTDAENILTGQTATNCTGTPNIKTVADQVLVVEAGDNHTVYFNAADGWAADGDTAAVLEGTVVLHWQFMA